MGGERMSTKESLLKRLKENTGAWISGGELSSELGVTRAAVSKHVGTLRKEGYRIEAAAGRGYLLVAVPDRMHVLEVRDGLRARVFGKQAFEVHGAIGSTNDRARSMAEAGAQEGAVVIAESQSAGRGRLGRQWFSPEEGGIFLSMILRPAISPAKAPVMTLMTAVSLAEALNRLTDADIRIKWPNDIMCGDRKLAGISTEIRSDMDMVAYVIVGIGINVNTPAGEFTGELRRIATSVMAETGVRINRCALVRILLERFERNYHVLLSEGAGTIIDTWKRFAGILGKRIAVDILGTRHEGRVVDVEDSGVLVLEDEAGCRRRFHSGDIMDCNRNGD